MMNAVKPSRTTLPAQPASFFEGERPGSDRPAVRRASVETTLFYDPPYDNELDDRFAQYLVAYLSPAASLTYKSTVWTPWTECRFDFLIDVGTRRVAIDYTDTPEDLQEALVEDNDALALGSGNVDEIFRIRRQDLQDHPFDVLHVLAAWEPALFTPYGRRIFAMRGAVETTGSTLVVTDELAIVEFKTGMTEEDALGDLFEWPDTNRDGELVIRRLDRNDPSYWERQYERASLVYGMKWVMRKVQPAAVPEEWSAQAG